MTPWYDATYCPSLGPFPSIGGGAHRPLTTLCPSSSSLAYLSLSTSLPLGRLCQRSPRTFPVSLLRVGSTQRRGGGGGILVHGREVLALRRAPEHRHAPEHPDGNDEKQQQQDAGDGPERADDASHGNAGLSPALHTSKGPAVKPPMDHCCPPPPPLPPRMRMRCYGSAKARAPQQMRQNSCSSTAHSKTRGTVRSHRRTGRRWPVVVTVECRIPRQR